MLEPVDVAMDKNGRVFIGSIDYENGEPVSSRPVEMTSQGAHINGLDGYKLISAGYACHIYGGSRQAYIRPVYDVTPNVSSPVVDITSGCTVGFRYIQLGSIPAKSVTAEITALCDLGVNIRLDDYRGRVIASMELKKGEAEKSCTISSGVIGKHAVYFEFVSDSDGAVAEFSRFTFDR